MPNTPDTQNYLYPTGDIAIDLTILAFFVLGLILTFIWVIRNA